MNTTNMEEAATIAAEYISSEWWKSSSDLRQSNATMLRFVTDVTCRLKHIGTLGLDNLPSEVQFLLAEMRIKDARSQGTGDICLDQLRCWSHSHSIRFLTALSHR
jgi:hypothetical protein